MTEAIHIEGHYKGSPQSGDLPFGEGSGLWWMGNTFTKEGVFGLITPHLDCGHEGPGVVPTGPVECMRGLGMTDMCRGLSHRMGVRRIG